MELDIYVHEQVKMKSFQTGLFPNSAIGILTKWGEIEGRETQRYGGVTKEAESCTAPR